MVKLKDDEGKVPKNLFYPNMFLWGISSITLIVMFVVICTYYLAFLW